MGQLLRIFNPSIEYLKNQTVAFLLPRQRIQKDTQDLLLTRSCFSIVLVETHAEIWLQL